MHRLTRLRPVAIAFLACSAASCGDRDGPTGPEVTQVATSLRVAPDSVSLQVPQSTTVNATVLDQMGRVMSTVVPTWSSRDSTTARITPEGVVTAVETGDAWLVAAASGLTDSVRVRVRFPVTQGDSRARIRGPDGGGIHLMSTAGRAWDLVGTDTLDRTQLLFGSPGVSLMVLVPDPPSVGDAAIQEWSIEEVLAGATIFDVPLPGAMGAEVTAERIVLYVGESGYVQVTGGGAAVVDGETGSLAGHLHLRAIGYEVAEIDSTLSFSATGDTVTYDVDFDATFPRVEMGYALVDFQDGPIAAGREFWMASVDWPYVDPPDTPLVELRVEGRAELTALILDPQPGTLSVYPQDPGYGGFGAGRGRTSVRMTGYYPYFLASGQGGTLTLTDVIWPEPTGAGELSGTLEASILYWLDGSPQNPVTGSVSMEFHALWEPKSASPASVERADGWSPWSPMISSLRRP